VPNLWLGTNSTLPTGAAVPPVPSPVEYFRKLLGMTAVERRDLLAGRSPESRKQIMTKVREYESLRPNVRELRLQATELRWYLAPLMKTPSTNRAPALALIPPDDRVRVEARLKEWDRLPPQVQQELLDNGGNDPIFHRTAGAQKRGKCQNGGSDLPGPPGKVGSRHPTVAQPS
jgi:hypothetical protein